MIEELARKKNHVLMPTGMNIKEMEAEPENKEHWLFKRYRKLEAEEPMFFIKKVE